MRHDPCFFEQGMKTSRRAKLALTAASASTLSAGAVAIVSAVPEIAPVFAIAGILAGGAALSAFMAFSLGKMPALVTFAMFVSLLPLFAIAGGAAVPLWLACWVAVGIASRRISMQELVERVTSSRTIA